MRFIVTIHEVDEESGSETPRYKQAVDQLDIQAVISAVNSAPQHQQPQRKRALRSDAGKPRTRDALDGLTDEAKLAGMKKEL